jgi:hypothetical protein
MESDRDSRSALPRPGCRQARRRVHDPTFPLTADPALYDLGAPARRLVLHVRKVHNGIGVLALGRRLADGCVHTLDRREVVERDRLQRCHYALVKPALAHQRVQATGGDPRALEIRCRPFAPVERPIRGGAAAGAPSPHARDAQRLDEFVLAPLVRHMAVALQRAQCRPR